MDNPNRYIPEDHSRRSRMHNIAVAIIELAERFKDDKDKRRIKSELLRRYIRDALDGRGLERPDLDEVGDRKAHGDALGSGGLGARATKGVLALTKRTVVVATRYLDDPDAFTPADAITATDLGLTEEPDPSSKIAWPEATDVDDGQDADAVAVADADADEVVHHAV